MSSNNIIIAVRVRPFSNKELKNNEVNVIQMKENETVISNKERTNKFTFDHCLWSFDNFIFNEKGVAVPTTPKYTDQKNLFDKLGQGILNNAWMGYNCTLFAYGQTGSGKTYSVMGYQDNKGIVPMICEELFVGINSKNPSLKKKETFKVSIGILEIYNERIRDLINDKSNEYLEIREDPSKGFYAYNQTMINVISYSEILKKIQEANKQKTIAATYMNETSSRAHTIVTIQFRQILCNASNKLQAKISLINLVDLAGSERVIKSRAEGSRLYEAQKINQSLSYLGNCLRELAEKQSHISYRNSVLTKLLSNALGGNSKTVLLVTISPSISNYEESLSTLRFAQGVKTIVTKAKINISDADRLISDLRAENLRLKKELENREKEQFQSITIDSQKEIDRLKEQIAKIESDLADSENSNIERLNQAKAEFEKQKNEEKMHKKKLQEVPHLYNLNDDPSLNKVLYYFFDKKITRIGSLKRMANKEKIDIDIHGINILPLHAEIKNDENGKKVTIKPIHNADIFINGEKLTTEKELNHYDRILFGNSVFFFYFNPKQSDNYITDKEPSIHDARKELAQKNEIFENIEDDKLLEELSKYLPLVGEANTMSKIMNKKAIYDLHVFNKELPGYNYEKKAKVVVRVFATYKHHEYYLSWDEFVNRRFIMLDLYHDFTKGESNSNQSPTENPFIPDESYPVCLGFCVILLSPLVHYITISESLSVINFKGEIVGHLKSNIYLCDKKWRPEEEMCKTLKVNDKMFLNIHFENFSFKEKSIIYFSKIYCQFKFQDQDYKSKVSDMSDLNCIINDRCRIEKLLDENTFKYLSDEILSVEIWGLYGSGFSESGNNVTQSVASNDPELDILINNVVELIKQRQTEGHKTIKISSLMKIAPEKYTNKVTTSICSIQ